MSFDETSDPYYLSRPRSKYSKTKTKTRVSRIVAYLAIASIALFGHDAYYASAWSTTSTRIPSSLSSSSSISSPSASSSKSNYIKRYTPDSSSIINDVLRTQRRYIGDGGRSFSRRIIGGGGVGTLFASLDFDSTERSSIDVGGDINVDNGTARSSDILSEEDSLPFLGVGRLYHSPKSDPTSSSPVEIIERLAKSTVAIVGIGGVGSWAAEALCRSGVGNILLVDLDDICVSNTNRQVHTTSTTVGRMKTEEMGRRLLDINPNCNVTIVHDFVSVDNAYTMVENLKPEIDIILDAIDGATEKAALIAAACVHSIPILTCGGAAGRKDPTQIVCDDLTRCADCRLLFSCKKTLRDEYKLFTKGPSEAKEIRKYKARKWRIAAVFSTELQKKVEEDGVVPSSSLRRCDGALGTACFVTGTYGFVAASKVVDMIAQEQLVKPRVLQSSVDRIKRMHHERKSDSEAEEKFTFF